MSGTPDDTASSGQRLSPQQIVTPNGAGSHQVVDVADLRRAAEVDFAGAQVARRDAVEMIRQAALLTVAAQRKQDEADHTLRAASKMHADAGVDELTGALRRGSGFLALENEIDRAKRGGTRLVLGFLDVDGLKEVNDTTGHLTGDELLRTVVRAVRGSLRSYDVLVRYGGDEFVFSLAGATLAAAERRFETVRVLLTDTAPGRTVSAGFAELVADDDLESLVRRADVDLYRRRRA